MEKDRPKRWVATFGGEVVRLAGLLGGAAMAGGGQTSRSFSGYDLVYMKTLQHVVAESGKIGYALLWMLGVPLPILLIIYLVRGS